MQNPIAGKPESDDPSLGLEQVRTRALNKVAQESRKLTLYGFSFVALFFGGFGVWSFLAPMESAIIATGQIIVEGNRKSVQHETGGLVLEIKHRDGDRVEAGEVLFRLDDTVARAAYEIALRRQREFKALRARLVAERDGRDSVAFSQDLVERADDPQIEPILAGQVSIFKSRIETLENKVKILDRQIDRFKEEIGGLKGSIGSQDERLVLVGEEIADLTTLLDKGLVQKSRVMALRRMRAEIEGGKEENVASIARAAQSIEAAKLQIVDIRNQRMDEIVSQLRDCDAQLVAAEEQLVTVRRNLDLTVVRSPQSGIAVGSNVHTVGGVIAPGSMMMQIVPFDSRLIVEAQVRPQDIERVKVGLPAHVRLLGFNRRVTPLVDGILTYVAADALTDPVTRAPFYVTRIEVDLSSNPETASIQLQPGMPTDVMIVTGKRTLVDYIASPIMDGISRGMREH